MPNLSPKTACIPQSFIEKKQRILADLSTPVSEYADKSPKGSVDTQILDLIDLVNSHEGWVTTSSCAGRVAVFVEGSVEGEGTRSQNANRTAKLEDDAENTPPETIPGAKIKTTPGGKGGGRWLLVSHDPIHVTLEHFAPSEQLMATFGLESTAATNLQQHLPTTGRPSLIHLQFSPLILHVLCASLHHAKPLLAAAINAGFRESGVQSLKALDDPEHGVMVGIRTTGLSFDSVIGVKTVDEIDGKEAMQSIVAEQYLKMCVQVIDERFEWNERRKARLTKELRQVFDNDNQGDWEHKDARAKRKREEGLRRRAEMSKKSVRQQESATVEDDLDIGLLHTDSN